MECQIETESEWAEVEYRAVHKTHYEREMEAYEQTEREGW